MKEWLHPRRLANPDAKCPRHQRKDDWRPLVEAAWAAGWWCERRRKYIYCYAPNGSDIVKIPMTPSDWRTLRNKRRDFAAAGLRVYLDADLTGRYGEQDMSDVKAKAHREANVLLELRMKDSMSEEVLDANSDAVLDAVQKHASDIALGPTISLNLNDRAVRLRFDVVARSEADVYRQIAKVVGAIEKQTELHFESSRSAVFDTAESELATK